MEPAAAPPLIACVAIVAPAGDLLYFRSFVGDEQIKLQLAVFASLDYVDEKLRAARAPPQSTPPAPAGAGDCFLGLLYPFEDYKTFGYVTGTGVRLVVVMRDVLLREDKVRELFRALHRTYVDAVSNPFASLDGPLTSPAFEQEVYRLAEASNSVLEYRGPSVL